MAEGKLIKAWINPLQFLEVDEPWSSMLKEEVTAEAVIRFLCTPGLTCDVANIVNRYKDISTETTRLFAAPAEDRILEKLVWPLRHAKAGYVTGNYLGTISLCGMVAEMVAILMFEISEFRINQRRMDTNDEVSVFGSSFEKLGQDRRINVLRAYNVIDDELKNSFELIRLKRKRYLHLWSQDHDSLPVDAKNVFRAAVSIVVRVIGQDVQDGKIILNPALIQYLERTGIYEPSPEGE